MHTPGIVRYFLGRGMKSQLANYIGRPVTFGAFNDILEE
jgi:hypothetical protein